MIGIILLITLLIGLLALVVVLIYSRQSEVELTDRSVDLGDVLPIQTITEDAIINGNGDITVGYRLFLPEVFTLSESDALYIHERLEALLKMLPAGTVVHQQNFYYTGEYRNTEYSTNALIAENNRHFDGKEILEQLLQPVCDVYQWEPDWKAAEKRHFHFAVAEAVFPL